MLGSLTQQGYCVLQCQSRSPLIGCLLCCHVTHVHSHTDWVPASFMKTIPSFAALFSVTFHYEFRKGSLQLFVALNSGRIIRRA